MTTWMTPARQLYEDGLKVGDSVWAVVDPRPVECTIAEICDDRMYIRPLYFGENEAGKKKPIAMIHPTERHAISCLVHLKYQKIDKVHREINVLQGLKRALERQENDHD